MISRRHAVVVRHEQLADGVVAGLRQREARFLRDAREKLVRDLHQNAGAVAGARIGADRAAMFEIDQDRQRVFDDLVRLAALDVGDESDAARILVERGIVEPTGGRRAGIGGVVPRAHHLLASRSRDVLILRFARRSLARRHASAAARGRA